MKLDKEKIVGIAGTALFHGIILVLFFILFLKTEKPLPGEEGVLVNVGYMEQGTGDVQQEQPMQEKQPTPPKRQPQETTESQPEKEIMTQEAQEAPALEEEKKDKKEEKKPEEEKKEPEKELEKPEEKVEKKVEDQPEPEKEEKPEVNPKALYKGKSDKEEGKNQGETGEAGDQGSPFGSKNTDNQEGKGGLGNGISFSLSGRNAKHLPKPDYRSEDQGKVVVTIYVDKYGNVKRAEAGAKGTTVTDLRLRKLAQQAALRAKFSQNPEAPEIQKGTITYNFIRMEN